MLFTTKTEAKKREIEVEDLRRSLDDQRAEYERLKLIEENFRKDAEKNIKVFESNERSLLDKIVKLEAELSTSERKNEKVSL